MDFIDYLSHPNTLISVALALGVVGGFFLRTIYDFVLLLLRILYLLGVYLCKNIKKLGK